MVSTKQNYNQTLACDDIMPTGWTPAAASSTLKESTRTFSRGQQCSCFRITVFYGVRAKRAKSLRVESENMENLMTRSLTVGIISSQKRVWQHAAANGSQTHGRPCRHIKSALPTKQRNDHWCSNHYKSTKTVPTVYQSSKTHVQQSQPTVYQQCQHCWDCCEWK